MSIGTMWKRWTANPTARRLRDAAIRNLSQRATYEGLPVFLAGIGITVSPAHATQIATLGGTLAGLVRTIWPDSKP